ncbi:MAG: phosphoribosylformylglycinamidine cyclo-ligase [Candidatus Levybacteria bacterium]|nr:phosphoribosylformylglycinamidine cyclo-ligase [Candidatus Levybacteria bacterium]
MKKKDSKGSAYASSGVNYEVMDPIKRLAQIRAKATAGNLDRFGMTEVGASRGESAYVWEEKDSYRAFVIEGLGSKNMVADEVRKFSGKSHYDAIAQDTVAMIVNDLIVVGADPQVVNAYFAVGDSNWFLDEERATDLIEGWAKAVNMSGAVWGGGETPTLKGIINPDTIDLSGSAVGIISPKERLTLGDKLKEGDAIFLIESNGIHSNGLTLARKIADELPDGYQTTLSDGSSYGESLLKPTHIYAGVTRELFEAGIDIHYMVNVTGHGWRKLMRANRELTYVIDRLPKVHPLFDLIQEKSQSSDEEMYGNFNMSGGFAIFMNESDVEQAQKIVKDNHGLESGRVGEVREGERQVIIQPKEIIFKGKSLGVR